MLLLRSIIGILCLNMPGLVHAQTPTLKATLHHTFKAHSAPPRQLAFSPDSKILATSGVDSVVKLWSLADGKLIRALIHPEGVTSIAFSRDGQWLVSGSYDSMVRVWRVRDGALQQPLTGYLGDVWSVVFSPNGRWLATTSEERTVKLWRRART